MAGKKKTPSEYEEKITNSIENPAKQATLCVYIIRECYGVTHIYAELIDIFRPLFVHVLVPKPGATHFLLLYMLTVDEAKKNTAIAKDKPHLGAAQGELAVVRAPGKTSRWRYRHACALQIIKQKVKKIKNKKNQSTIGSWASSTHSTTRRKCKPQQQV